MRVLRDPFSATYGTVTCHFSTLQWESPAKPAKPTLKIHHRKEEKQHTKAREALIAWTPQSWPSDSRKSVTRGKVMIGPVLRDGDGRLDRALRVHGRCRLYEDAGSAPRRQRPDAVHRLRRHGCQRRQRSTGRASRFHGRSTNTVKVLLRIRLQSASMVKAVHEPAEVEHQARGCAPRRCNRPGEVSVRAWSIAYTAAVLIAAATAMLVDAEYRRWKAEGAGAPALTLDPARGQGSLRPR
jgi:hypothetical protein